MHKYKIPLSRGRCGMPYAATLPENGATSNSNQIYFEEYFTVRIFYFISHVRWVQLHKDYLYHEYKKPYVNI